MKICTITCHRVYNYGASLQAYALQNYLEGKGHTVKIIDYRPWYLNMRYNFWFIAPISRMYSVASRFWIIRFIYCLLKRRDALKNYGRKRAFDNFTQQYLRLTDRSYNTLDSLKNMPPLADLYIAGSDQIWNSNYNNGRDPAFYLDFGSINIKRASYAASFAINAIQEDRKPFVKNQLKKFDYISVRERTGLEILRNLGINDAFLVNDPVFLLDKEKWLQRKDLIYTGRTLFGAMPPKGQELDDHYFGTIRQRIASFMRDVNIQLWKVGVPAKTQHNEVAPAQHELAPIYAVANIAVDHNQLIMETLKKVAYRHGLQCLLHEKPFAGVNGSGKHDNWSITTDDGINLLEPGKTPHENIQFLLVLTCILKAVDTHADLLRESAADVGNDHRLGANEAPPAILSVYLGEQLEDVLSQLISTGAATHSISGQRLETGVKSLPDFMKDATDRNRTSPFAFTGNKFEFRMVGSQDSVSQPNVVLNTIVAEAFAEACDELEKADDFDMAVHDLIKKYATEHQRIVFNGNGYSDEWVEEAERRGLPNIKSMVDAIPALNTEKAVALFEKFGVFTKAELDSRVEIEYETYAKEINIEAKAMIDIATKQIIPAVIRYTTTLAESINAVKAACGADISVQTEILMEVSDLLADTKNALSKLEEVTAQGAAMAQGREQAVFYRDEVMTAMKALRTPVDKLEMLVDKSMWPMPSYGDLMFEV